MSILTNPAVTGLLDTQLSNLGYMVRGWWRVDGEKLGLPQAVKKERKMDYQFRDFYMVFATAYTTELAYRLVEHLYVVPNFLELLQLNRMKEQYRPGSIHTPDFARNLKTINNFERELPSVLRGRMLGSFINPRSYYMVPDLIEQVTIPEMVRKKASPAQVQEARLWAHHLRRVLNPEQYLDDYLLGQERTLGGRMLKGKTPPKISAEDGAFLRRQLKRLDGLSKLFDEARKPLSESEFYERLLKAYQTKPSRNLRAIIRLPKNQLSRVFQGSSWKDLFRDINNLGLYDGIRQYRTLRGMSREPVVAAVKQQPTAAVERLALYINRLSKLPAFQNNELLMQLKQYNNAQLAKVLEGPSLRELIRNMRKVGIKQAGAQYRASKAYVPDEMFALLREKLVLPYIKNRYAGRQKLVRLFEDLSQSKVVQKQLHKVFETSGFWLKLPLSILSLFLVYGLVANTFDAKILQPYQREIVKRRGDSTEFVGPGFAGALPGLAAFGLLMKTPFIQKLGYLGSFAVAGLGGLAAYAVSTYLMFQYKLRQPRTPAPSAPTPGRANPFAGPGYSVQSRQFAPRSQEVFRSKAMVNPAYPQRYTALRRYDD